MSHIDGTMEYYLKSHVSFPVQGRLEEFHALHFEEYKGGSRKAHFKVRKIIAQLLGHFEKESQKSERKNISDTTEQEHLDAYEAMSEALTLGFDMVDSVDGDEFLLAFEQMVIANGLCKVDGKHTIKDAWSDVSEDEQLEIAVRYCCFFGIGLLSALMSGSEDASKSHTQAKEL